jgi:hypothetical protein
MSLINGPNVAKAQQHAELERLVTEYTRRSVEMICERCGVHHRYNREHVLKNKIQFVHCGSYRLKSES